MDNLYLFGEPGEVGGAATKINHLLSLLKNDYHITVVLNDFRYLKYKATINVLSKLHIKYCLLKELPQKLDGIALVICEKDIFVSGTAKEIKKRGLKLIFSNEMMFPFEGEIEAAQNGLIDKVLFVSEFQEKAFEQIYKNIPSQITGNYIDADEFPYTIRNNTIFTIGRLSRPDIDKYSDDFPVFYEELGIQEVRYRIMAWDDKLKKKFNWFNFDKKWDLLPAAKENTQKFLCSLDLFVYTLRHTIKESWGRAPVEAMLTGCVTIVPSGHQFHKLIDHGKNGFICGSFSEYKEYVNILHNNNVLYNAVSLAGHLHAKNTLCSRVYHRDVWLNALK